MSTLTRRHMRAPSFESEALARRILSASRLLPLLVLAITFAAFGEVGTFGFVRWDDNLHVTENPWLHPVTPAHMWHFWQTPYQGLYIPLSYTVYSLLALLARGHSTSAFNPHVFHVANLALHLVNVLLVFTLLKKFVSNAWAATAGALLFGIHPVQVESVAWISELRGLLSGLCALVALWQYLEYAESRAWGRYALATTAFGLALFAKPSAVAVPLLAAVLAVWGLALPWKRCLPSLTVWAAMALACACANHSAQSVSPDLLLPLRQRFLVAGDALAFHLGHLVLPTRLGIDYGRSPSVVLAHNWGYWTWLAPVTLGICLWALRRRWPLLFASGALFVAALLPVLGLVPFAFQAASTVADRYAYLAMLGPALAVACLLAHVPRRVAPPAVGLCIVALLLLGLQCALQASYWQNDFALFSRALAVNPRSWISDNNLGTAWSDRGQIGQAIVYYRDSLTWNPRQEDAWNNLGVALCSERRWSEATWALQNAQRLAPDAAAADNNLGVVFMKQGRLTDASQQFKTALRLEPDYAHALDNLAEVTRDLRK